MADTNGTRTGKVFRVVRDCTFGCDKLALKIDKTVAEWESTQIVDAPTPTRTEDGKLQYDVPIDLSHITDQTNLPKDCNITVECYDCYEDGIKPLETRVEALEDPDNFKERVIEALDNDGDGDFDADDIDGLTDFITNNVSNGNIIIDASNITNFATEVAQVITTDPATQTAIIDVVQGGIDNGSIVIDANDVQGFCSKVSECIATGASNNDAIATALAPLLEPKIQIEDLSTNAPAGSRFYSDGNGNVNTTTGVYTTPPATNVGSPIVSDISGQVISYYWNGTSYVSSNNNYFPLPNTLIYNNTLAINNDGANPRVTIDVNAFGVPSDAKMVRLFFDTQRRDNSASSGDIYSYYIASGNLYRTGTVNDDAPTGLNLIGERESVHVDVPVANGRVVVGFSSTDPSTTKGGGTIAIQGYTL